MKATLAEALAVVAPRFVPREGSNPDRLVPPVAVKIPDRPFRIVPAGCIHWPLTDKALLKAWVKDVQQPDTYTVLMGDAMDFARTHFRRHIKTYVEDENSREAIDDWVRRDVAEFCELVAPVKDRILGAIAGNHHHTFLDGTNTEQLICRILGTRYLGAMGILRLDVGKRDRIVVYAHHDGGSGGGRTPGGDLNALVRQRDTVRADLYLLGHTHKAYSYPMDEYVVTEGARPRVVSKQRMFVRVGCFRSVSPKSPSVERPDNPDYAVKAAYPPTHGDWVEVGVHWTAGGDRKLWYRGG